MQPTLLVGWFSLPSASPFLTPGTLRIAQRQGAPKHIADAWPTGVHSQQSMAQLVTGCLNAVTWCHSPCAPVTLVFAPVAVSHVGSQSLVT